MYPGPGNQQQPYQQQPQYGQQYGQPGGYPPGFPGGPPPRKSNTGMIVIIVSVVVAVLAGGGIAAFLLLSGNDKKGSAGNIAGGTPQAPPPAAKPDKHTKLPGCKDLANMVPDLPPLDEKTAKQGPRSGSTYPQLATDCTFKSAEGTGGHYNQVYSIRLTAYLTDPRGYPAGTEEAVGMFEAGVRNGNEEAKGLGVGDRAAWVRSTIQLPEGALKDCPIEILDGNVTLEVRRAGATDPTNQATDPASPTCRQPTLDLAKLVHQATLKGRK
ncbi:hypothetical protein [Amycolatopsis anabasis]|uniref:hypothetical protein n=1 Tax=Amycolatopsis anabasis TaxID=1840409 RepID=UPI00131A86D4|nr:hypothetical protein [Amycolatopsis anabasis]